MNDIKQKVKEKIRQYSSDDYLDGYIKNEYLVRDDRAEIILKISDRNELFDPLTFGNQLNLNDDIYHFIDSKSSMLDNNLSIVLNIKYSGLNNKDEEKIKHIISEHYAIELHKAQKEYRRYKSKIFKLVLAGAAFMFCYAIISFGHYSDFLIEVFGFLFSFALWQAFETLIYTLSNIKLEREAITQKLVMDIKFDDGRADQDVSQ